jgi:ABC-2 type transport system permease protein
MEVKKLLKFIWEYFKINLQSAMEYRTSFITQATFMFLNDVIWVIFWVIFFNKFTMINNWAFKDLMIMYVVITSAWGLVGVFAGNFRNIAEIIRDGQLDFYLALPKEELTHVLVSKSKFDAFGDLVFGLILAIVFIPLSHIPLTLLLIVISALILLAFAIILGSLSFYIGSAVEISNQGLMGILSIGSYPFSVFSGYTKFVLLTLIPAGFISGVPVDIIRNFDLGWFLLMVLCAVVLWAIALIVFKLGVRKYESGNLINARM